MEEDKRIESMYQAEMRKDSIYQLTRKATSIEHMEIASKISALAIRASNKKNTKAADILFSASIAITEQINEIERMFKYMDTADTILSQARIELAKSNVRAEKLAKELRDVKNNIEDL